MGNVLSPVRRPAVLPKGISKMIYPEEQLEELKAQFGPGVREFEEGGHVYLYIPGLKMPPGCTPEITDALLCPQTHSGYTSRLFFKERIQTTKQVNWNGQFLILGVQWYAFSYNYIKDMPLMNMIMSHLRGMVA